MRPCGTSAAKPRPWVTRKGRIRASFSSVIKGRKSHPLPFCRGPKELSMAEFCRLALICGCAVGSAREVWAKEQSSSSAAAPETGRERFEHADVLYGWVTNGRGDRLRTFITRPKESAGKVPAIFFVGWLSCDSVEYPKGETDGFGALIRRIIDQSGYATMRVEKSGVGESQGPRCEQADFQYGRPAKFYQQLQSLNLGFAWQQVSAPVLVIRGTSDDLMSRADGEAIVDSVNRAHPGLARYLEIEQMTHGFNVNKKFHDDLVPEILGWMRQGLQPPK